MKKNSCLLTPDQSGLQEIPENKESVVSLESKIETSLSGDNSKLPCVNINNQNHINNLPGLLGQDVKMGGGGQRKEEEEEVLRVGCFGSISETWENGYVFMGLGIYE